MTTDHFTVYKPGFIAEVKEQLEKSRLESEKANKPLKQLIAEWHEGLPESEKLGQFSMAALVKQFGRPPALLSKALFATGWRRKRSWKSGQPFYRYWEKLD